MDIEKLVDSLEAATKQKAKDLANSTHEAHGTGTGSLTQDYERGLLVFSFGGRVIPELAMIPEQAFVFGMSLAAQAAEMMEKEKQ